MEIFQPKAIVDLQNTLSTNNIERLKSEFVRKNYHPEDPPLDINQEKGIFYCYDSHSDSEYELKFEDSLSKILLHQTNKLKSEIDQSNILLNSNKKKRYWQDIINAFEYIQNKNQAVFDLFPVSFKPQETIKKYLFEKYHFNPLSQFEGVSFFTVKRRYSLNDFESIYDFLTNEMFIDDEIHSFEDFKSVFNDIETNSSLTFNCETPLIIRILEKMKPMFSDFTTKKIEESGRFLTKQRKNKLSKPITVSIYNSNKKRGTKPELIKNLEKISNFFDSNFPN